MRAILGLIGLLSLTFQSNSIFLTQNGKVNFTSDAPLELIQANSDQLRGVLDIDENTFAFLIPMNSFLGFNDPLQKEHFCEKFLDCGKYPQASFKGKIIEDISYDQKGTFEIRAKGEFNIHGIIQERIIKSYIEILDGQINISSKFSVKLVDHKIKVPQIVYNKVAEVIYVEISAQLTPKDS